MVDFKSKAESIRNHFDALKIDLYTAAEECGDPAMPEKLKHVIEPAYNDARSDGIKAALRSGTDQSRAAEGAKVAENLQKKLEDFVQQNPAMKDGLEKRQGKVSMDEFQINRKGEISTSRSILHTDSEGNNYSGGPENLPADIPFEAGKIAPVSDYAMRNAQIKLEIQGIKEAAQPTQDIGPAAPQMKQQQTLQM